MLMSEELIQEPNIYSRKILFEHMDTRNKKRMAQMKKRKTALSTKHKSYKIFHQDSSPKAHQISQKT